MGKGKKTGSLVFVFFVMLLLLLSAVSCTPILIGEAACGGSLLVAATTQQTAHPNKNLKTTVTAFNNDLIFGDYNGASAFVSGNDKKTFWAEVDRLQHGIRLTDFDLRDTKVNEKNKHATVILHFQYYRTESAIVQAALITQEWDYSQKDKKWRVSDSGLGAFALNSH